MEQLQGWEQGTGLMIAGGLVALWYVGRLLIKILVVIQRIIKRIMGAIARFLQPVFEFLYRSLYVLAHVAVVAALGYIALGSMDNGIALEPIDLADIGGAVVVISGLTVIVFRHFLKFPLRKGQAQGLANEIADGGEFADDLNGDLDIDLDMAL